MSNYEKLLELEQAMHKLGYFPVTYVTRDDLRDHRGPELSTEEATATTDETMATLANAMGENYVAYGHFWDDLEEWFDFQ